MIKRLLPILFPSWRFFSSIGPSPRIDVAFLTEKNNEPHTWIAFSDLPQRVGFAAGVRRLFHNPGWNERLYMNTCAEHLFEHPDDFYAEQIGERLVCAVVAQKEKNGDASQYLVFRIRALEWEAGQVSDEVVYISRPFLLPIAGAK